MEIYYYAFLALGAFVTALIGTRGVILVLRNKRMLLDVPSARSNHKTPTPRGGGIAVVFTLMIFLMLVQPNFLLLFSLLFLAGVSLVDDWMRLSPWTRLIAQVLAILPLLIFLPPDLFSDIVPGWLEKSLIVISWLWFINLFNFMDGIDGIAAAETISIGMGILMITALTGTFGNALSLSALIVLSAAAGFLWWNWSPAKIFLGDVGSIPLGYLLGYLLLTTAAAGYGYAALILPAYYICDATLTLVRRAWKREKIWEAHSQHFYQQAVRGGHTHDAVVRIVLGVNMLLILLAVLASLEPSLGWLYLAIAYGMVLAVLFFAFRHEAAPC